MLLKTTKLVAIVSCGCSQIKERQQREVARQFWADSFMQVFLNNNSTIHAGWLYNRIIAGHVTHVHDSPIGDTEDLALCAQDYIPAGTYSIVNDGGDAVIIL